VASNKPQPFCGGPRIMSRICHGFRSVQWRVTDLHCELPKVLMLAWGQSHCFWKSSHLYWSFSFGHLGFHKHFIIFTVALTISDLADVSCFHWIRAQRIWIIANQPSRDVSVQGRLAIGSSMVPGVYYRVFIYLVIVEVTSWWKCQCCWPCLKFEALSIEAS
jgi:hypothetical protein